VSNHPDAVEIEVISGNNYNREPGSKYVGEHVTAERPFFDVLDEIDEILDETQ